MEIDKFKDIVETLKNKEITTITIDSELEMSMLQQELMEKEQVVSVGESDKLYRDTDCTIHTFPVNNMEDDKTLKFIAPKTRKKYYKEALIVEGGEFIVSNNEL